MITVFYDEDCGLCTRAMCFMRRLDRQNRLTYETLGSEAAESYQFEADTMAVVRDNEVFLRSEAVRVMLESSGGIAALAAFVLKVTPLATRDRVYRWVAKNRYRWFGSSCVVDG